MRFAKPPVGVLLSGLILAGFAPLSVGITTPSPGAVLRGSVSVVGGNQPETGGFSYSEVAFAYQDDPTGTWFLIATNNQSMENDTLATWDTASISDGDYVLRLRVYLRDGGTIDVTVTNLHVRNDVPISTATPPVLTQDLPTPAPTLLVSTSEPVPVSPTLSAPMPSPGNPASLTDDSVLSTFRRGAVFALIAFALIGLFLRLRASR